MPRVSLFADYRPHAKQIEFHRSGRRFEVVAAGVRAGKTYAGAREFLRRVFHDRASKQGRLWYWVVAPIYDLLDVARQEIFDVLGGEDSPLIRKWEPSKNRLWLHGNIRIDFKSADRPERLVSASLDGFWMDEAARCPAAAWPNLRARVADKQGWGIFTTSPMGMNWFYEEVVRRGLPDDEKADPEFAVHTFRTVDNTAVPGLREEVEKARKQLPPKYFRRDFEASFEAFAGKVYDELDPALHLRDQLPGELAHAELIAGVDWGFANQGVLLVVAVWRREVAMAIEEDVAEGVILGSPGDKPGLSTWVARAKRLQEKYAGRIGVWYCDPSEPEHITVFRRAGLNAKPADNALEPGIQTVATWLHPHGDTGQPRLFIHRRCRVLWKQLNGYHRRETRDGVVTEEIVKENDHTCDALRYAMHTHLGRPHVIGIVPKHPAW